MDGICGSSSEAAHIRDTFAPVNDVHVVWVPYVRM